ncbi:MAG: 50S ribosomal protein L20 [Elusimicrobia bacterium]|nr:MAG: 50S ribosomal protein L20 [Elusimicrobiota bacterium]
MRIKGGQTTRARKKKIFKAAKGAYASKSKNWRHVVQHVEKALNTSYSGRKDRKTEYRSLWITRLNAACREEGTTYAKFIAGLKKAEITLNRKMLSEMALRDAASFKQVVELSKG